LDVFQIPKVYKRMPFENINSFTSILFSVVIPFIPFIIPTRADCAGYCYGNGFCNYTSDVCICNDNFYGPDCQQRRCPKGTAWFDFPSANNVGHTTLIECSNMGHCDKLTGLCTCRDGFYGSACQYSRCPQSKASSQLGECSGHGRCMTMHEAAKEQNYVTLFHSYTYSHWDAHKIQGCICDPGWTSGDCSLRTCPRGDDPGSTGQANEVQLIQCLATSGSFSITFRGHTTVPIPYNANIATVDAAIEALETVVLVTTALDGGSTVCDSDGVTMSVTFTNNPGDVPPMVLTSSLNAGSTLILKEGGATSTYNGAIASVTGTREYVECSNRGLCNRETGLCECHPTYASSDGAGGIGRIPDCGYRSSGAVSTCFLVGAVGGSGCGGGLLSGTSHGTCHSSGTYCTACDAGYTEDCSRLTCPFSRSWFSEATGDNTAHEDLECGGVGHCDRTTGKCTCLSLGTFHLSSNQVFEGDSCSKLSCPYNSTLLASCGNKGTCLSMSEWAAKATDAEGTVLGLSYTGAANSNSWDHNTMQGCFCDYKAEQFAPYASMLYTGADSWGSYPLRGYDCKLASCAVGDNPITLDGAFEVQTLVCSATSGTFTLTFRGFTTSAISYNAVALISDENTGSSAGVGVGESLQSKLHNLFTIHPMCYDGSCTGVDVVYSSGAAACTSSGTNTITLTFKSELGNVPLLIATTSSLGGIGTVVALEKTRGTKEASLCSDHGVCDVSTGRCLCHKGYASSNGDGSAGLRSDCGFRTMFAKTDNAFQRYRGGVKSLVTQVTSFIPNTDSSL
jgi:hypothetical protein